MTFSFIDVKVPGDASQNNKPQMLMNAYQSTNQPALLEQATPEMYDIISKELDRVKDFDVDTIIEQRSKYINQQNLNEGAHHVVLAAAGAAVAHHLGHDPIHGAAIGATLPMATRLAAGTALVGGAAAGAAAYGAGKGVHHIIKKGVEHFHKKVTVPYHKKQADHHEKMRDHHANHDEADDDDHSYKAELHHDAYEKHKVAMKDHSKSSEAKAATAKVHAKKYKYDQGDHAKLMGRNESFNEGLKGDQHKLDHDNDGDIDGKDFEMLRMKKKKKKMDSPTKDEPEGENGDTASMNPKMGDKTKKEYSMSMKPAKKKLYMSKESKIRTALKSVVENRGEHYRSATPPETMDDKLKGGGAKKMKADLMKGAKMNDTVAKAPEDAKAAGSRGPSAKPRNAGDNTRNGDSKIVPPGTPMKDPSSPNQRMESFVQAYTSMHEKTHMMTVDGYTSQGEPNAHKKFNVTKKVHKGPDGKRISHQYGGYKVSFHGSKENLAKYNDHHFDNEEKIVKKAGAKTESFSGTGVGTLGNIMDAYRSMNQPPSLLEQATQEMYDIVSQELDRVKDFNVDTIIEERSSNLTELPPLEESVKLAAIGAAIAHHLGHDPVHGAAIGATLPITAPLAIAGTAGAVYGAVKGGQAIHKGIKNMAKAGHDHFKKHVLGKSPEKSPEKKPEKKSRTYVSGDMVHVRRD